MRQSKQHGFTLMELLIAMVLLSIAFIALQKGIVLAQQARINADELRTAEMLYRCKMLEISTSSTARSQHNGAFNVLEIKAERNESKEAQRPHNDFSEWRWRAIYNKTGIPDVLRIALIISRRTGTTTHDILMEERLVWLP